MRAHHASGYTGLAGGRTVGSRGARGDGGTPTRAVSSLPTGDQREGSGGGAGGGTEVAWGRKREKGVKRG